MFLFSGIAAKKARAAAVTMGVPRRFTPNRGVKYPIAWPKLAIDSRRSPVAMGYSGEPVLLAIPSAQCLAAGVPIDRPAQLRQRQTLLYQLEQCLPLAAEDVVADFINRGQEVLGVAVETSSQRSSWRSWRTAAFSSNRSRL